ncbi:MAG: FecR family protein [Chitinophagaceae bacterium]
MNKDFDDYTVESLVWDEDFRRHIMQPNAPSKLRWEHFASNQIDGAEKLRAATTIILALGIENVQFSDRQEAMLVKETLEKISFHEPEIDGSENLENIPFVSAPQLNWWRLAAVAAVLVFVAGTTIWAYNNKIKNQIVTYEQLVKHSKEPLQERFNGSALPVPVLLSDGSRIVLEPGARISFPVFTARSNRRVVYLAGDAAFTIAHDPSKPFFVHSNELTTRVVGTEFRIRNNKKERKVSVEVVSGIVAVSSVAEIINSDEPSQNQPGSLILTRNQKVSFSGSENRLTTTIVDDPLLIGTQNNHFEETPVREVFETLEKGYGIDIIYDEKALNNVTFTANLAGRNMYQQVEIICKSINARYEVIDGKIVIYALQPAQ